MSRRALWSAARFLLVCAFAGAATATLGSAAGTSVRADIFVVLVGGYGLLEALRWLVRSLPASDAAVPLIAVRRNDVTGPTRPPQLVQLERMVSVATADGRAARHGLRPRIAALAAARNVPAPPWLTETGEPSPVPINELSRFLDELEQR